MSEQCHSTSIEINMYVIDKRIFVPIFVFLHRNKENVK